MAGQDLSHAQGPPQDINGFAAGCENRLLVKVLVRQFRCEPATPAVVRFAVVDARPR